MTQPLGPPTPPKPAERWTELRYAMRYSIPRSLRRTQRVVQKMQHRRRVG